MMKETKKSVLIVAVSVAVTIVVLYFISKYKTKKDESKAAKATGIAGVVANVDDVFTPRTALPIVNQN